MKYDNEYIKLYNTKMLVKKLLDISNKEFDKMVKKANSEAELELVHNYIWACRKLEAFVKEYKNRLSTISCDFINFNEPYKRYVLT